MDLCQTLKEKLESRLVKRQIGGQGLAYCPHGMKELIPGLVYEFVDIGELGEAPFNLRTNLIPSKGEFTSPLVPVKISFCRITLLEEGDLQAFDSIARQGKTILTKIEQQKNQEEGGKEKGGEEYEFHAEGEGEERPLIDSRYHKARNRFPREEHPLRSIGAGYEGMGTTSPLSPEGSGHKTGLLREGRGRKGNNGPIWLVKQKEALPGLDAKIAYQEILEGAGREGKNGRSLIHIERVGKGVGEHKELTFAIDKDEGFGSLCPGNLVKGPSLPVVAIISPGDRQTILPKDIGGLGGIV